MTKGRKIGYKIRQGGYVFIYVNQKTAQLSTKAGLSFVEPKGYPDLWHAEP